MGCGNPSGIRRPRRRFPLRQDARETSHGGGQDLAVLVVAFFPTVSYVLVVLFPTGLNVVLPTCAGGLTYLSYSPAYLGVVLPTCAGGLKKRCNRAQEFDLPTRSCRRQIRRWSRSPSACATAHDFFKESRRRDARGRLAGVRRPSSDG